MRIKIIRIVISLLFVILALNLIFVQVVQGPQYYSLSVNNRIRVIPLEARRGRLKDRNGLVLVDNRRSFDVAVIPQDVRDNDELFDFLSTLLKEDRRVLLQRFWRRKITPFAPVLVAADIDKQVAIILEENRFRFPGLYVQEGFRRDYPFGEVGAHILGYVGKIDAEEIAGLSERKQKSYGYTHQSIVGKNGVEKYYDKYLRGRLGGLQIEVNSRGQQVRLLSLRDPESGQDIELTIDQRIQMIAADLLKEHDGTIIVMNQDSGDVLGMVSSPSYDPNIFVSESLRRAHAQVFSNASAPLLNRAIKGLYPPGSVFKLVVFTAGLAYEKISRHTTFVCTGGMRLGGRLFRCSHVHGREDALSAIAHSCNTYAFHVGLLTGAEEISEYARFLNLGVKSRIDLPFEETGSVPSPAKRRRKNSAMWHKGDTLNFAIGQGATLITPIQLTRMMATIAGRGKEVQPHLIHRIRGQEVITPPVRQVNISSKVFDFLLPALRAVVNDPRGTARRLDMKGFETSGKTGTAQSAKGRDHHAWFVGFDTSGKENIVFCVFLEYGGSSVNAVVMAKELLQRMREADII